MHIPYDLRSDGGHENHASPAAVKLDVADGIATSSNQYNMSDVPQLDALLSVLREHQTELRVRGVRHAAIFGSVARQQATESSDIDVLVDLDPEAGVDIFEFDGIEAQLSALLNRKVDLVSRRGLKLGRHDCIEDEAVLAF